MITISLCMIVKNEEKTLERCLDSVADLMDEIIIVDTGSTDKTKEIAKKYTDKIYDFEWIRDFAAARNFSFSKATMEYIYAPDADEVLDEENRMKFLEMKQCLLPEIELVQMKYVTVTKFNTVLNAKKEYRPKLFKRLRTFTWIDPIHETVRLDPVVYDSEIEILHMPEESHGKRDFSIFLETIAKEGKLSQKLRMMYEKELLKCGDLEDLEAAIPYFKSVWNENPLSPEGKEAACVLTRAYRLLDLPSEMFKYALRDMLEKPCAEICYELGCYYQSMQDFNEAIVWYLNATEETESIIDICTSGNLPLEGLVKSYCELADLVEDDLEKKIQYLKFAEQYQDLLDAWDIPEML